MGEYKFAGEVLEDFVTYLREQGVEVEGDDVRGFDYHQLSQLEGFVVDYAEISGGLYSSF